MKFPFVMRKQLDLQLAKLESLQQEFRTYKKRNEALEATARLAGGNEAFRELLPVFDNLQRALDTPCEDEAYVQGIRMTMDSLKKSMDRLGIAEIPALGTAFDPTLHEAMDHIEDPELGESTVAQVVLAGFTRNGTVIRHALVVVAN